MTKHSGVTLKLTYLQQVRHGHSWMEKELEGQAWEQLGSYCISPGTGWTKVACTRDSNGKNKARVSNYIFVSAGFRNRLSMEGEKKHKM